MIFNKQNRPTKNNGEELINKSNQLGELISDGTTNRVLIGYQKDGFGTGNDYGVKVSQQGINVLTANPDELVMSSAFNMFKIVESDSIDITKPANDVTGGDTVLHGLGYAPLVIGFVVPFIGSSGTLLQLPFYRLIMSGTDVGKVDLQFYIDVNSTNVNFIVNTPDVGPSSLYTPTFDSRFYYYIIRETAGSV